MGQPIGEARRITSSPPKPPLVVDPAAVTPTRQDSWPWSRTPDGSRSKLYLEDLDRWGVDADACGGLAADPCSSCFHLCQVFGGLPQRYGHELPAVAVGEQVEALETRSLTLRREAFLGGGEEVGEIVYSCLDGDDASERGDTFQG